MTNFKPGDVVEIVNGNSHTSMKWLGFKAEVVQYKGDDVQLRPLSERPDGAGFNLFYWPAVKLSLAKGEGFRQGDIVEIFDGDGGHMTWMGLQCKVINPDSPHTYLKPLSERPDGFGVAEFVWPTDKLKLVKAKDAVIPEGSHSIVLETDELNILIQIMRGKEHMYGPLINKLSAAKNS